MDERNGSATQASSTTRTLYARTRLGLAGLPNRIPALTASSGFSAGSGSGSRSSREICTAVSCTWVTSGNGGEVSKSPDPVSNTRLNSTDLPLLLRRRIPDSSSSLIDRRCNFPNGRCSPIRISPGVMIQTTLRSKQGCAQQEASEQQRKQSGDAKPMVVCQMAEARQGDQTQEQGNACENEPLIERRALA